MCLLLMVPVRSQGNDFEAAMYNISTSAVFSSVGALINKRKDQTVGEVLKRSLLQGAAGGYLIFESKRFVRRISHTDNLNWGWAAKITNSLGNSIVENTSLNKKYWHRYHINIGFFRFGFQIEDQFNFQPQIMPFSFTAAMYLFAYSNFDAKKTLQIGEFTFKTNINLSSFWESSSPDWALLNNIQLNDNYRYSSTKTLAHEMIHVYQYYSFNVFNPYYEKPYNSLASKSKGVAVMKKWVYWDMNALFFTGAYRLADLKGGHSENRFENEARYYSR